MPESHALYRFVPDTMPAVTQLARPPKVPRAAPCKHQERNRLRYIDSGFFLRRIRPSIVHPSEPVRRESFIKAEGSKRPKVDAEGGAVSPQASRPGRCGAGVVIGIRCSESCGRAFWKRRSWPASDTFPGSAFTAARAPGARSAAAAASPAPTTIQDNPPTPKRPEPACRHPAATPSRLRSPALSLPCLLSPVDWKDVRGWGPAILQEC